MGVVVRVADLAGREMTKKNRRSDDAIARRLWLYRTRRSAAATPADEMSAAFDLYRGEAKHGDPTTARLMADRLIAFVESSLAERHRNPDQRRGAR